jgi:polyhydroxybutyrate depolymerase
VGGLVAPRVAVIAALLVLTAAACGSADLPQSVAPPSTTTTTPPTPEELEAALDPTCVAGGEVEYGTTVQAVESAGVTRAYLQHIPASYEGVGMPVVVALHHDTGDAQADLDEQGLVDSSEAHGFVLLAPQAAGEDAVWDTSEASADVAMVADVLDQAATAFCAESERVYVLGSGDGSDLAGRLACDLSTQVAAVALVGVVPDPDPCAQERPVPIVALPGFDADFTPWVERYECDATPVQVPFEGGTIGDIQADYEGCVEGAAIQSLTVLDLVALNDAIWAFFAAHPLSAA